MKIIILSFTIFCFAAEPSWASTDAQPGELVCQVEQIMMFGDHFSDYPDGPGFLGSRMNRRAKVAAPADSYLEQELQDTVNKTAEEFRGAKLRVNLRTGEIASIPFGPNQALVIQNRPGKDERAVNLSPGIKVTERAIRTFGYIENRPPNKILMGVFMAEPMPDGFYSFKFLDFGEMLLGYC